MYLKHAYWHYHNIVPKRYCDYIIKYAKENYKEIIGSTSWNDKKFQHKVQSGDTEAMKKQYEIRKSNVIFFSDEWVYRLIRDPIKNANINADWNFDYDWFQACQFTIYKEKGYYDWHRDTDPQYRDTGKIRKVSASLMLNEPDEYTGGDFEFKIQTEKGDTEIIKVEQPMEKGSLLVFPSHLFHRVKPVETGTRHSLVIWAQGPYFR